MSIGRLATHNEVAKRAVFVVPPVVKKSSKCRSFHFRYLELCRAKNLAPVSEVNSKANTTTNLELYCDKLGVTDWDLINEALYYDKVLQSLIIRMRRAHADAVVESVDSERRARLFRHKPVIYTKYVFNGFVGAIANCIESNKKITVLKLECLPLHDKYIEAIAKALASNESLSEISFHKSNIGDKGCEFVCNTVKYLNGVEKFDLSDCRITTKGSAFVAEMIKMQKITRFTQGWERSLRYRSVDINSIPGLREINLANNPEIADLGIKPIVEVLKEDAWVKTINAENCGLTDLGANLILECLSFNTTISEFIVRHNDGISKFLQRNIRDQLGKKDDEEKQQEPQFDLSAVSELKSLPSSQKYTMSQLLGHTKTLEEQVSFERLLRKKAEKLNEKLNHHFLTIEGHLPPDLQYAHPADELEADGRSVSARSHVLEDANSSQTYRQMEFTKLVNSAVTTPMMSPRTDMGTLRKSEEQPSKQFIREEYVYAETEQVSTVVVKEEPPAEEQRKPLKVRKVRSEMKYVETHTNKKIESKSDHEFANERVFNLTPVLQFETDIGDSAMVNNNKDRKRHEGGCGDGNRYADAYHEHYNHAKDVQHNAMKKAIPNPQSYAMHFEQEQIGDNSAIMNSKINNERSKHGNKTHFDSGCYGDGGDMMTNINYSTSDYEHRKGTFKKTHKKRQKSKHSTEYDMHLEMSDSVSQMCYDQRKGKHCGNFGTEQQLKGVNDLNVETYMDKDSEFDDNISVDSTLVNSQSQLDEEITVRGKYKPMEVFMRRKTVEPSEDNGTIQSKINNTDYAAYDGEDSLSPRTVYKEMKRNN